MMAELGVVFQASKLYFVKRQSHAVHCTYSVCFFTTYLHLRVQSLLPLKSPLHFFSTATALLSPLSAPTDSLSSTPGVQSTTPPQHIHTTEGRALLTTDPLTTFSSPPAHTVQDSSSTAHASTIQRQSESLTTAPTQSTSAGLPQTSSAPGRGPAVPTHKDVPSELNVGDEGDRRSSKNKAFSLTA